MKYEHRYLFVEILEGVLLVMLGVATMLRTEQVLDSLTLIFGILAVITGLADVMFYIRPLNPPEHRAIRGRRGELLAHSHIKRGGIDTGRNSAV